MMTITPVSDRLAEELVKTATQYSEGAITANELCRKAWYLTICHFSEIDAESMHERRVTDLLNYFETGTWGVTQ